MSAAEAKANLFFFNAFTCSVPGCCSTLTYKVSTTSGSFTSAAGATVNQYPGSVGGAGTPAYPGEVVFSSASSTLGSSTDYYIYATNEDAVVPSSSSFASRSSAYSPKFTWTVICGPTSATITEGSYPSVPVGLSNIQSAESNNTDSATPTRFILP